jgi:hypothetical protein
MQRHGHSIRVGSEAGEESGQVISPAAAREAVRAAEREPGEFHEGAERG